MMTEELQGGGRMERGRLRAVFEDGREDGGWSRRAGQREDMGPVGPSSTEAWSPRKVPGFAPSEHRSRGGGGVVTADIRQT